MLYISCGVVYYEFECAFFTLLGGGKNCLFVQCTWEVGYFKGDFYEGVLIVGGRGGCS